MKDKSTEPETLCLVEVVTVDLRLAESDPDLIQVSIESAYRRIKTRMAEKQLVNLSTIQTTNTCAFDGAPHLVVTITTHVISQEALEAAQRLQRLSGGPSNNGKMGLV
jgi:hypothetical protein